MENPLAYRPADTPVHALDARVKVVLLLACSIALLAVGKWWSLAVLAAAVLGVAALGRVPLAGAARAMAPLGLILAFTLLAPALSWDDGALAFQAVGLARGAYNTVRIVLLMAASIVLTATSSPEELLFALRRLLAPLSRLGFPVNDAATAAQIALRFMPIVADQIGLVARAHAARGAHLGSGGPIARVRAWARVLTPVFVGLFRRASSLAVALDARCYGAQAASHAAARPLIGWQRCVLLAGISACAALALWG